MWCSPIEECFPKLGMNGDKLLQSLFIEKEGPTVSEFMTLKSIEVESATKLLKMT
jgi:hypothetical protein